MPGSQSRGQASAQSGQMPGGENSGGSQQSAQTGADGHEQQTGGADSSSGDMNDTAQASQRQSNEIDFSEEESSAGSPRTAQNDAPSGTGTQGGAKGTQGQQGNAGDAGSQGPSAQSYDEQVAVLDRELEGSMGEYDGMILRERQSVLNRSGEEGSEEQVEDFDREVAYYEEGDLGEAGQEGEQQGGQPNAPPGSPGGQGGNTETVAQSGGHPNGSDAGGPGRANDQAHAPPDDIPSGDDDDVVARQIREAALYEDDPELREKLWEEYRKYKAQS